MSQAQDTYFYDYLLLLMFVDFMIEQHKKIWQVCPLRLYVYIAFFTCLTANTKTKLQVRKVGYHAKKCTKNKTCFRTMDEGS